MIALVLIVLAALTVLFTTIQTLYLESMRLRTRELPALEYFKAELESKLKMRSEDGNLTYSLWKHACLVFMGVFVLVQVCAAGGDMTINPMGPLEIAEALLGSLLLMNISAYLIPQLLYRRSSGRWIVAFLPFYTLTALAVRPFVAAISFMNSLLDIVKPQPEDNVPATPAENIDTLITAGTEEGLIEENDRKLIESVIAFGDKVVREVMTPRPNMVTTQADATLAELHELVVHEQFSRIPVCQSSIDDIIGFVHVRDMFEVGESERLKRTVRELMRPIRLVPETKSVHDLMREMQHDGSHMVIVVDEYGNTAGLATMEDLVEVILGEIRDEHEPDSDVKEDGKGGFIVSGNFDLARLADMLGFHAEEDIESTTVGGLIMEWLGRVPKAGETMERDGIRAEVLSSDDMRVCQVHLSRTPQVSE